MSDDLQQDLQREVTRLTDELGVTGTAAGIWHEGRAEFGFAGVTSVTDPLAVDARTLFQFGSTAKTFTATAIMCLVERGLVDLHESVRTYVPELRTRQSEVAEQVTVLQLLNHTAGWDGDFFADTGDGDDALATYVTLMAELEQVTPPGASVSYNNASLSLAGRVVEKVTGSTFEQALSDLVLTPLQLEDTFAFPAEVLTRRFAVGHTRHDDGSTTVCRPWKLPRAVTPAGGLVATAADQIAWARFHLEGGTARDGSRVLAEDLVHRMQQPTADMRGSALGDAVGISWLLSDVGSARLVSHGGSTNGQYSGFTMVPASGFAVIAMTNSGPNGPELDTRLTAWALQHYLGVEKVAPELLDVGDDALAEFAGHYETIAADCDVQVANGRLAVMTRPKASVAAVLGEDASEATPTTLALVAGDDDPYVISEGPGEGMRGYFRRDAQGRVDGLHLGGRLATRTADPTRSAPGR